MLTVAFPVMWRCCNFFGKKCRPLSKSLLSLRTNPTYAQDRKYGMERTVCMQYASWSSAHAASCDAWLMPLQNQQNYNVKRKTSYVPGRVHLQKLKFKIMTV